MVNQREASKASNALTYRATGAAMEVHQALGVGLWEKVDANAWGVERTWAGRSLQTPRACTGGVQGCGGGQGDLLVDETLMVELKVASPVAQVLTCLRASTSPLGLILNFGVARLKDGDMRRGILSPASLSPRPLRLAHSLCLILSKEELP